MNTLRIRNTVIGLIIVLASEISFTNDVSAGFFDWLNLGNETEEVVESNWTFDRIFSNLKDQDQITFEELVTIQQNSIMAIAEHISPENKAETVTQKYTVVATAYSSTPDQTDSSPFITASGTYVRDGIIATNFLPFGSVVKIPDIYGDKLFVVEDRMNQRYTTRIDIWFSEREAALQFGKRTVVVEVLSVPQS